MKCFIFSVICSLVLSPIAQAQVAIDDTILVIPVLVSVAGENKSYNLYTVKELQALYPQNKSLAKVQTAFEVRPVDYYVEDQKNHPEKYANIKDYENKPEYLSSVVLGWEQEAATQLIEKAGLEQGQEWYEESGSAVPNGNAEKDNQLTCYMGNGNNVDSRVFDLASTFYTEQMFLWGSKFKSVTYLDGETEDSYLQSESAAWKNYDSNSDDFLLVIGYSDDGDDVNDIIISKCK